MPKNSKTVSSSPEITSTLTPREIWENSEWQRISRFIRENKTSEFPYPIPGLTLNFRSDNGKIRMQLDVKEKPSFRESVKKNMTILNYWRQRLTAFENRPKWEFLPHPGQILVARSKKGRDCLEWMKTHDPGLWNIACKDRGQGLSPGKLSQELNRTIEAWLTELAAIINLKKSGFNSSRFYDSVGLLMIVGFAKKRIEAEAREEAVSECKELLASIQRCEDPFNNGRAKYCRPVTQEMLRKRIDSWTS